MKVESLVNIIFEHEEVTSALVEHLADIANSESDHPSAERRRQIVNHLKDTYTRIELSGDKFVLMADGVASLEDF